MQNKKEVAFISILKSKAWSIFFMLNLFLSVTNAQEADFSESDLQSIDTSKYKKINVNFEDEMVKGGAEKPELEYLFQKSNSSFKKMIRLRENFIPDVQKGKDDMRGLR